jgi:hypothetical protein
VAPQWQTLRCPQRRKIAGNQERPTVLLGRQQEIRERPVAVAAAGMNQHACAAIEKLPRHLEADTAAGTGDDDIAVLEQLRMKHETPPHQQPKPNGQTA